jgi:hypothetical protein
MNQDGTRDVEVEEEDDVASPLTLLRRILQHDSHALTAGFEVRRTRAWWNGEGPHGLPCTCFSCTYSTPLKCGNNTHSNHFS